MQSTSLRSLLLAAALAFAALFVPTALQATDLPNSSCSVLAVMSYHDEYPWQDDIRAGILHGIGTRCRLTFFSLDSNRRPETVGQRAAKARELVLTMKPDAVIAADDAVQKFFIVPYMKDQTGIPVIFCGVNETPEQYGYPARNVTGILERYHGKETMQFLKQVIPKTKNFVFLTSRTITADAIAREIREEASGYPLVPVGIHQAATIEEAVEAARAARMSADALYLEHFEGIPDRTGRKLSHREALGMILDAWGNKPSLCANEYSVKSGCLLAVQKSGFEQGAAAAKMALEAISGTPVSRMPVIRNYNGVKVLNVQVMKQLGLSPPITVFREAKLVKTDE